MGRRLAAAGEAVVQRGTEDRQTAARTAAALEGLQKRVRDMADVEKETADLRARLCVVQATGNDAIIKEGYAPMDSPNGDVAIFACRSEAACPQVCLLVDFSSVNEAVSCRSFVHN